MPGQATRFSRFAYFPAFLLCFVAVNGLRAQDTTVLPQAQVGKPYSISIGVDTENGKGQFTWKLTHGDLPPGLQVSVVGKIEGTPTETKSDPYVFDLNVSDSSQPPQSAKLRFTLSVVAPALRVKAVNVATTQLKVLGVNAVAATPVESPSVRSRAATPDPVPPAAGPNLSAEPSANSLAGGQPVSNIPASPPDPSSAAKGATGQPGSNDDKSKPKTEKVTASDSNKDWEARAIVGYHQAGASSAKFTQNFFFDFFIMRALSSKHLWEANWNLWGDVRIASAPQQVTAPVGTFLSNFATQVSNLPVNQLAQSADFQTGFERRLLTWERNPSGKNAIGYRMFGLVGYFGAMGEFQPPDAQIQIFNVPDRASQQFPAFAAQFPTASNAKFVGFVPPNRERFYRNYGFGFRVTTFDKDEPLAPPATYTLTIGEDESITGGIFRSVVGRIDVFYPLPASWAGGTYKFVYLFGNTNLRLSRATNIPTFALQNPNANGTVVQPFDPNLAIVTVRSTRDTYRFGVGVDLVNLYQSITNKGKVATPAAN